MATTKRKPTSRKKTLRIIKDDPWLAPFEAAIEGRHNDAVRKIDELTGMQVFSLDVILGFVAKLHIIDRWLRLDPESGRKLFAQLVDEIRNNKKPIE